MCRHTTRVLFLSCLILSAQAAISSPHLRAMDDPPQYEQLIKDLGNADEAVWKAAVEKLATAEAIPSLVQAVGGADDNVSSRAADVLFTLMDSDKPDVASQADAAVAQLERSPEEAVAKLVGSMLERREEAALQALHDLGVPANRAREGFMIRIYYGWKGGDEGFKHLRRLRGPLTLEVTLEDEPATFDRGWQGPSPRRRTEAAGIPPTTIQGVVSLGGLRNLESVSLTMLGTHDDLVRLADLPQLKKLSLIFPDDATGGELAAVAKLTQLERLKLFKAPNLEEHLEALATLPALKSLEVAYDTSATASGLAHVSKFVQLETLTVANVPDLGACLPELARLPRLRQLALVGMSVTDGDLVEVGKMADLEDLMLQGTAVTDDGLAHLKGLAHLRRLLLPWTTITDDAIPHLQQLSALEILNVHGSFLSTRGVTKLSQYLPDLWMGDLAGVPDNPFQVSPGAPRNARTKGVGLTPAPSPEHCQAVREITRLGGMVYAPDDRSSSDPAPEWRTAVVLGRSWRGGEEGLALLAKLEHVSSLDLNTPVPNSAADLLRRLVELQAIILRDTLMTDQGLSFLGSLPNLKSVALVGPFTDAAVPYLSHTTAEYVQVKQTQISDAGQQAIRQALQPNRQTAERVEQMNEAAKLRAVVARACVELPTDPAAKTQARSERNRAREELLRSAMAAIPLLVDAAQHGESGQRIQALFLLHRLGSSNVLSGFGTPSEEVVAEVQEAFEELALADQQPSAPERTDEEKALIALGHLGGRVTFAPEERGAYHVTIFSGWSGGDEGLSCLSHLHPLHQLGMYGVSVSAKGLAVIGTLTDLRGLHLALSEEGGQNLAALRGLKQLSSLTFTPVNDEALRGLVGVDSITSLLLGGVSDRGLQYVGQLPQLKSLRLYDVPDFTGSGLQYMAGAAALEGLGIEEAPSFTGAGLEHLAGLESLRNMTFLHTGVLGQSLSHLASLPGLEQLSVWASPVTEAGVRHIGQIKQLKRLSIVDSTLLDAHLKYLADLPQLERLDLNGNGISDEGIIYLAKLRSLEDISIDGTFITEKAKAKLFADLPQLQERRKRIPPMQRDRDRREELPDVSPEYLAAAREIIGLGARVCRSPKGSTVWLFANWAGGDEKLALLEQLGDLREMTVKVPLTDSAIPYLKKWKQLRSLVLERHHMSKDGIEELKKALPDTNVSVFHESQ